MSRFFHIILFLLAGVTGVQAQPAPARISVGDYIVKYKDIAIRKMQEHRIPASITLAQGILESSSGNSDLALYANNHFGIKCHETWTGEYYIKDDDEKNECFRKYPNAELSFEDHSRFLQTRSRYAFLFEFDPTDYRAWAYGLKKAGYATNPKYPELLIRIIEENRLFEYDQYGKLPFGRQQAFSIDSLPREYKEMLGRDDFGKIELGVFTRRTWENNRIRFTIARAGDDPEKIARDLDIMTWQVYRYNELEKGNRLSEGQIIYLQPKRRKAEKAYHVVKHNETMYTISQLHGIKLKHLYRKNRMEPGNEPYTGQKLWLRETRPAGTTVY